MPIYMMRPRVLAQRQWRHNERKQYLFSTGRLRSVYSGRTRIAGPRVDACRAVSQGYDLV